MLLTNERYKTYQTGFSFSHLGHARGVGLWGTVGGWGSNFFSPKFNQSWCGSYLLEWHMQLHNILGPRPPPPPPPPPPLGPWGGAKRSNIIKSQLLSQFQRFSNQTLCVYSQMKDIKHIRQDFHLTVWVMAQGWDLGVLRGLGGGGGVNFFSEIQPELLCDLLT